MVKAQTNSILSVNLYEKVCFQGFFLKMAIEPKSLIPSGGSGGLFQSLGAAVAKLLSPNMT